MMLHLKEVRQRCVAMQFRRVSAQHNTDSLSHPAKGPHDSYQTHRLSARLEQMFSAQHAIERIRF